MSTLPNTEAGPRFHRAEDHLRLVIGKILRWSSVFCRTDPAVPKQIEWLERLAIPGRWGRTDAFARGLIDIPGGPAGEYARESKHAA